MRLIVQPENKKSYIHPEIYGNFSEHLGRCIYNGIYVGEDSPIENVNGMRKDIVDALKKIKLPVLRWPGGCFADEYHWMDGIGKKESRKKMINTNWGGVVEDNSFGTHEFFELCRQIGCEPYINGNVGSGTVREMAEWIEYISSDNFAVKTARTSPGNSSISASATKTGAAAAICALNSMLTFTASSRLMFITTAETAFTKSPVAQVLPLATPITNGPRPS